MLTENDPHWARRLGDYKSKAKTLVKAFDLGGKHPDYIRGFEYYLNNIVPMNPFDPDEFEEQYREWWQGWTAAELADPFSD